MIEMSEYFDRTEILPFLWKNISIAENTSIINKIVSGMYKVLKRINPVDTFLGTIGMLI